MSTIKFNSSFVLIEPVRVLKRHSKPLPQSTVVGDSAVDRGRGFECLNKTLTSLIKTKLELGFIVDIASFQLTEKSSNLVMFWLPKTPSNFTKNQHVKTINLVQLVNFGGLNYFFVYKYLNPKLNTSNRLEKTYALEFYNILDMLT